MPLRSITYFLSFVALFPLLNASAADQSVAGKESAEKRLQAIETRIGGRLGIAAIDTGSGHRLEHRANERFPMCSTFKLLAAAAVLHRVDENKDHLTRVIPYTEADLLEYAPVTRKHVAEGGMTLDALCAAAIEYSDNTAGNLLLKTVDGSAGFTRYARALGDKQTRLDRIEPDLNSALPDDERDTTTPVAMAADLRRLLVGDALSPASRAKLEGWLAANTTGGEMIRTGLPNEWKMGDKTGRGSNGSTNDIAILRPPGKAPILLAIYSVGSTASRTDLQTAIADVARVVGETF